MKMIGFDVSKRLTRQNYFRHQVLEYVNTKGLFGVGEKLRTPTYRGFLKRRRGSELDISTNYIQAEHEVMAQMLYDIEVAKVIHNIDKNYNIVEKLKHAAAKINKEKDREVTWQDLIPEGYTVWAPREGNVFYLADSIPARLAEEITRTAIAQEIGSEKIKKVLAMGRGFRQFVIKEEIAKTLDNLTRTHTTNPIAELDRKILRKWK